MNRREILAGGLRTMTALALVPGAGAMIEPVAASAEEAGPVPPLDKEQWQKLDAEIRKWWDADLTNAQEDVIRNDESKEILFVPFPYLRITPGNTYGTQFPYDAAFMNYALFAHDRLDIVRNQLLNHVFLIERYGYAPNSHMKSLLTRSQTPFFLLPTFWRYYSATKDKDFLYTVYPQLKREYRGYWNAPHHQTPIGLATDRDLGDPGLSPELAAEAEVLDWTPTFGGDVRRCVPVATNSGLVSYARVLALMAKEIGREDEAHAFTQEADKRTALIDKYCWNEQVGQFLEYDFVAGKQLPYISEYSYWTLWAGVASRAQAARLAANVHELEKTWGVACDDKEYPDPHKDEVYLVKDGDTYKRLQDFRPEKDAPPEYVGGTNQLMWAYPAGWASTQIVVTAGLDAYGYGEHARRISSRFLSLQLAQYKKTGNLWEKYNVVDGSLILPNARYGNIPYHSFSAAAVVILGRRVFDNQALKIM